MPLTFAFGNVALAGNVVATDTLVNFAYGNADDTADIGFYGQFYSAGTKYYTGLVRKAGSDYYLFTNSTIDPTATDAGNVTGSLANFYCANLNCTSFTSTSLTLGSLNGILKATAGVVSGSATTTDLPEGTNQYFTTSRARTSISATGNMFYNNSTGVITIAPSPSFTGIYLTGLSGLLKSNGISGCSAIAAGATTTYLRGDFTVQTLNTSVVPESTNQYYTDARARGAVSSGSANIGYVSGTGVFTLATTLSGLTSVSSTTFVGALTGNASTATALSTAGTTNQFWKNGNVWGQPTQADISGLTTASSPSFTGLTVSGSTANTLTYFDTSKALTSVTLNSNITLTTGTLALNTTITGLTSVSSTTFVGALTGNASTATALSTAGSTNQFWKNGNVWAQPTQADISGLTTASSPTFAGLTLTGLTGVLKAAAGVVSGSATTTDVPEGSNLYFTTLRAQGAISGTSPISYSAGAISLTTVPYNLGGTGQTSYAKGDIVYASAINTLSKLTIGSLNQVLAVDATGVPVWSSLSSFGVSSVSAGNTNITVSPTTGAVVVTLSNTPSITDLALSGTLMMSGYQPDTSFAIGRSFTASGATAYNIVSNATLTTAAGAAFRSAYGLMMMNTFVSNTSNTPVNFHNIFSYPTINATAATVSLAYAGYFAFAGGSGTITSAYSSCFVAPSIGTNRVAVYTDDLQVGGSLLSGSTKSGYLYVNTRFAIGQSANNVDRTVWINRSFTSTSNTTYNYMASSSITTPAGAGAMTIYGMILNDTFTSNTSNTSCNGYSVYSAPSFTGSPVAFTNAYGIYSTVTGSGTITNAYGSYIATPSVGTNKVAQYCESFQCGGTISGTVPAGRPYDKYGYLQPIGAIIMICTTTVPAGWLYCNGQAVSRTTYADLYAIIGVAYGTGDGSTTFNVPDFRAMVPRGQNDNATTPWYDPDSSATYRVARNGSATGNNLGSYQADDFRSHYHALQLNMRNGAAWWNFDGYTNCTDGGGTGIGHGGNTTVPSNNMVTGNETRARNVYVRFIIKY